MEVGGGDGKEVSGTGEDGRKSMTGRDSSARSTSSVSGLTT